MPTYWSGISGYKPHLTVSAYGTALGAPVANNGADYGPDTSTTSTSGIQEAINAAASSGNRSVYLINDGRNFNINTQLLFQSYVSVVSNGATLLNNSALQYPFATPNNSDFYRAEILGLVLNGNGVSNCQCLTLNSPQRSVVDVFIRNALYGCAILVQTSGTPIESVLGNNATLNRFRFQFDNIVNNETAGAVALSLQGNGTLPTVVTDNRFEQVSATNVYGIGIQLVEWADSNDFGTVLVSLAPNSSSNPTNTPTGVILNNLSPYNTNVGVYNNRFAKLSVDAFGFPKTYTGVTGILFNYTYQNVVSQFITSPGPTPGVFPGTRYDFNLSASHFFRDMYNSTTSTSGTTHVLNMPSVSP